MRRTACQTAAVELRSRPRMSASSDAGSVATDWPLADQEEKRGVGNGCRVRGPRARWTDPERVARPVAACLSANQPYKTIT